MDDSSVGAGARDGRQVDPQVGRPLADRRSRGRPAGRRSQFRTVPCDVVGHFPVVRPADVGPVVVGQCCGRFRRDVVGDLDPDERAPDAEHVARFAVQSDDRSRHRWGDLDRRLVGQHLRQHRVGGDLVADRDQPTHDLGLRDPLPHVGELHLEQAHAVTTFRIALPTRSGPGKYDHSCACG